MKRDIIKSLESVKRSLAKEMPERWAEKDFLYAQGLARVIIGRLEKIVRGKIEVKGIDPKTSNLSGIQTTIYLMGLESAIHKIPQEAPELNEETLKKVKPLARSIVRRLQCFVNQTIRRTDGG